MEDEDDTSHTLKPWWKTVNVVSVSVAVLAVAVIFFLIKFLTTPPQKPIVQPGGRTPTPVARPSIKEGDIAKGQIIVKFKEGISDSEITARLKPLNASIKGKITGINATIVEVPVGQELAVTNALSGDPIVKYSEPDFIYKANFVPNDTYYKNEWGLANTGQTIKNRAGTANADIQTQRAWDVSQGNGVKVAVLDTGIDMSHPDLASKVVAQKVFATSTIDDKFGHGTHVAGIIAAATNNGQGIAGVCPGCQLVIGKVMNDNGEGQTSTIGSGITWAADSGAKVINMSEGGSQRSAALEEAIIYAWNKGVVLVAAAGNENTNQLFYPAALTNVISVASSGNTDRKSSFSNYGTWVNVAAPGEQIYSTLPTHAYNMQKEGPLALNYDYLSGTSMASPVVAGVAGLVWGSPQGTSANNVVRRVIDTADKITGTGQYWESGRVNAANAVGTIATVTTAPTRVPTNRAPTSVAPTFVCGGSTNNICPTTPPAQGPGSGGNNTGGSGTATPIQQPITQTPGGNNGGISPIQNPSNPNQGGNNGRGRRSGQNPGLIQQFFQFLLLLLNLLLKMLGGGTQ